MDREIKIITKNSEIVATLLEEERPETCDKIWNSLPFKGEVQHYKEEIYFDIPVEIDPEEATPETDKGDVSYWPQGSAFCIFYGTSQPVSPVNTFAKIKEEDIETFKKVESGEEIKVKKS